MVDLLLEQRRGRARKIAAYLKKAYPVPKTELRYTTPMQLLVAVMLSAQSTDKQVNKLTATLFKTYKTARDFAKADPQRFEREVASVSFFRNKAKAIRAAAKIISDDFGGRIPHDASELVKLPGIGYKTAHVVLGELHDSWEGIPTDTHVKRFAYRFDLSEETDLKKISHDLERLIPKKDWRFVNNGLVLYGRYICPARPHDCRTHPLTKLWLPAAKRWQKVR
jgi:endonuclease III